MSSAISVSSLYKTYSTGFEALKNINLDIRHGEIFALLGPNGAGKTTLISAIWRHSSVRRRERSSPTATRSSRNIARPARKIGLVPQELTTDAFEHRLEYGQFQSTASSASRPTRPISRRS